MKIQGTKIRGLKLYSSAATVDADSYFNLVSLLLPGNGTNGAQNNTFLDSSTNNFAITRNGNTTQGTFSPFSFGGGTAQTDGYYSGYFDGTGDYLNLTQSAFAVGTGNFTLEAWVFLTSAPGTEAGVISSFNTATGQGFYLAVNSSRQPFFAIGNGGVVNPTVTGTAISLNTWVHLAAVRSSGTISLYVNGSSVGTPTSATASIDRTLLGIGLAYPNSPQLYITGFISNARITSNAVYTSNFTVPITPLTAIANTSLLTCQSSQFIDNSANAFAITANGNSQPTVVNPFGMTDWSGYFDGTGDYLSVANNAAFDLGSGDATIETWIYPTSSGQTCGIFDKRSSGVNYSQFPQIALVSGAFVAYVSYSGSSWAGTINGATPAANTWTHVAFVRSGNTWTLYVNGAVSGTPFTASGSVYTSTDSLVIGASTTTGTNAFAGQISNARVVKGTAVYTSAFTPPTAPLTAISGTSLLTCQSSTFVDNSTNAFTITVNGNAYTGTLNNPFNSPVNYTTPPLQAWSNYFNGGSDRLSNASANVMDVGTGNFTIEMWVFLTSTANQMFFEGSGNAGLQVLIESGVLLGGLSGTGAPVSYTLPSGFTNTWHHIAYVREGTGSNQVSLYVDGIRRSQGTLSNSVTTTGFQISRTSTYLVYGYISNLRVVKNSAVYTGATITVPTAPLTAIANTSLLTCQSNRFVDNSINRCAITVSGSTSVQPFSPFNPDAAYSTTSVGGSAYFDGSGDYLTVPDSASFDLPGDFTVEFFAYATGSNVRRWFQLGDYRAGQNGLLIYSASFSSIVVYVNDSVIITGPTLVPYQWVHVACVRQGAGSNNLKLYVNGSLAGQVTNTTSFTGVAGNGISLGAEYGGSFAATFETYMSNVRLVKGTAVYTSAFTPPTAPLTAIANTQLLVNYTNAGIPDATAKNVLETVGNAQISTAQSKFGGSSMAFDGSGDALILPASQNLALETGNFTIEMWVYGANNGGTVGGSYPRLFSLGTVQTTGSIESYNAAGTLYVEIFGSSITFTASTLLNSSWNHFAISRSGSSVKAFVNGTQVGSTLTNSTNLNKAASSTSIIGAATASTGNFNGYIDDLRITKGYARYTANFTPPTAAFPTQ